MKRIGIFLLLAIFSLTSCSINDSDSVTPDNITNDYYFKINLLGSNYEQTEFLGIYEDKLSYCGDDNIEMTASLIADVEGSNFNVFFFLCHFSDIENFETLSSNNSSFYGDYSWYEQCMNNFDINLGLWLFDNNEDWLVQGNDPNDFSNIESVKKQSENDFKVTYSIKGSFKKIFFKNDQTPVSLTADYLVPISLLK